MINTHISELGQSVWATELYDYLGLNKGDYSKFIKREVLENPYADEKSYLEVPKLEPKHGRFRTEYHLSIRFAMMLCRVKSSEKSTKLELYLSSLAGSEIALIKPKRKELIFGDMLDNIFLGFLTFIPQAILGKYRVDFFCPELQLCVEYDEFAHKTGSNPIKDKIRESEIKEKFGFQFLRVDEGEELLAINHLIHLMAKLEGTPIARNNEPDLFRMKEVGVNVSDIKKIN